MMQWWKWFWGLNPDPTEDYWKRQHESLTIRFSALAEENGRLKEKNGDVGRAYVKAVMDAEELHDCVCRIETLIRDCKSAHPDSDHGTDSSP
jgi:hypothetical protein